MSRDNLVRFLCPDPRYDFCQIGHNPLDLIVPVPGVFLGSAEGIIPLVGDIPEFRDKIAVFMPHAPCSVVSSPKTAHQLGVNYAEHLHCRGIRAVSLFLGEASVELHDPLGRHDLVVSRLFSDACRTQRTKYSKNPKVVIKEVAIAPFFDSKDLKRGALYLSSLFLCFEGLANLKKLVGTFPTRNYSPEVKGAERALLEAAFEAV